MNTAKVKLAVFSFVMGIVSLLNLLGLEKSIVAIVFGIIALRELAAPEEKKAKTWAYLGIALGIAQICILIAVIILKGPEFLSMLKKL